MSDKKNNVSRADPAAPALRIRMIFDEHSWMGPGKADLLELIAETGSIAAAGRRMGMSYKRAWMLVETLNAAFAEPVVESVRGGASGGGARLTETGQTVLDLYRALQKRADEATRSEQEAMRDLLRDIAGRK